jgi:hypothetical protein
MQAAVDARLEAIEAKRGRASKDAEARADKASRERDALAAELDTARQSAAAVQAAADDRVAAIEAERARLEMAWKIAEARADEANSEYEAVMAELRTAQEASVAAGQNDARLEAAAARIRALELQLFGRDRGASDTDVELASLLEAPSASEQAVRRAERHRFPKAIEVEINGGAGELIDLSVGGAQFFCPKALEVNTVATLSLPGDGGAIACRGRVVWIWREPSAKGRPRRYRAGMLFLGADEAAVNAFITRHTPR